MQEKNSVLIKRSRYVGGGVTEVNARALEWWDRSVLQTSEDDGAYVVERRFIGRLDLIAAYTLGDARSWWIIAMLNNILDPYSEIYEGRVLYVPTKERAQRLMEGQIGGVPSTREVPPSILPIV